MFRRLRGGNGHKDWLAISGKTGPSLELFAQRELTVKLWPEVQDDPTEVEF